MAATRLSRLAGRGRSIWANSALARVSLGLLSMAFCQSCIVADPPEYREPVRTRPLLDTYSAVPSITQILTWNTGQPRIPISVGVRSEDAGTGLSIRLFLDYGTPVEVLQNSRPLPASTYDQARKIEFDWLPIWRSTIPPNSTSNTCHTLTLIVAHSDSFLQADDLHLDPSRAGDDAAIMSWWVNYNAADPSSLSDCPSRLPSVVP